MNLQRTLREQMPPLDALRGIAILLVLAHRFNVTPDPHSLPARLICAAMELGWVGVQLFFVLSGFLITGILLDSRQSPDYYRSFYARRTLRIFPLYYTVLLFAFVLIPLVTHEQPHGYQYQLWMWTYLSNWFAPMGLVVAAFPHFWSLAVEEQFYLAWPFLVRALTPRRVAAVCGVLIVGALVLRIVLRLRGVTPAVAYQNTLCRIDALAMGALLAWALRVPALADRLVARTRSFALGAAVLFALGGLATHGYPRDGFATQTAGYTILAFVSLVVLFLGVVTQARGGRAASLLAPAPLRSIGKYSYAMYIFHVPLHHYVGEPMLLRLGYTHPTVGVTLVFAIAMSALTYVSALASYHLLEVRFLRLKRLFPVAR